MLRLGQNSDHAEAITRRNSEAAGTILETFSRQDSGADPDEIVDPGKTSLK